MDKIRSLFRPRTSYEPLEGGSDSASPVGVQYGGKRRFSWIEYSIFVLLGIAMLWAWNMFLAAGPYFQKRFSSNKSLLDNFQAAELFASTITNLGTMLVLTKIQKNASYPGRIISSLFLYIVAFVLLSISTKAFRQVGAESFFAFLIAMILTTSLATGFMQNGTFSYVSAYGRADYVQAIMTGQGIAGILPCVAQMATVLAANGSEAGQQSSTAAMAYFLTATGMACVTLVAFLYLQKYHDPGRLKTTGTTERETEGFVSGQAIEESESYFDEPTKTVPLLRLAWKLRYLAGTVFTTFGITMMFPVFTQKIISVNANPTPLFQKAAFIPLAFLLWNMGDLVGRMMPLVPRLSLTAYPKTLLILSICRVVWIPLYLSCNIQPAEVAKSSPDLLPTVRSDAFYLVIVQFLFGLTNGYVGSSSMMGYGEFVDESEREAAGGFMGTMLVAGLAVGSIFSFLVGNAAGS